jgi:hypothetical protein
MIPGLASSPNGDAPPLGIEVAHIASGACLAFFRENQDGMAIVLA